MKITTKIVWDADFNVLAHEFHEYSGPVAECKSGKSDNQKAAEQRSASDAAQQTALTNQAQGTLGQFEGPVQDSPFYKTLLTTGTEATSDAYQNAQSNVRQRANQAGFGYNQPAEQGAEAGVQAAGAKAQAQVPGQALMQAGNMGLQAASQTGNMGMGFGQQGLGYNQSAAQMDAQRNTLWQSLLQAGGQVGGGLASAAKF